MSGFGTYLHATETVSSFFFVAALSMRKALKANKFSGLFAFWLLAVEAFNQRVLPLRGAGEGLAEFGCVLRFVGGLVG
ncbi:hypothetical protein PSEUDO8Z_160046 [Pseudomonas sp. 8Z]|nr:hypothetical protein PSEUDO8Z_160046 [Pseudomonas sp. 8Z]